MLLRHVAIVSESDNVNAADVSIAAAAIQKQVTRDFGPIWAHIWSSLVQQSSVLHHPPLYKIRKNAAHIHCADPEP